MRQHHLIDDLLTERVGKDRFQPTTYGDADQLLIGRQQNDDAFVIKFAADGGMVAQITGIAGDIPAVQAADSRDDDLVTRTTFGADEIGGERAALIGRENRRKIGHATAQPQRCRRRTGDFARPGTRRCRRRHAEHRPREQGQNSAEQARQPRTGANAATPALGPAGCAHTALLTAMKSAPAATSGAAFSAVMPPIATLGSSNTVDHQESSSGCA